MSQADELLANSANNSGISLQLANATNEPHISIDNDRVVSVPKELRRIAVQFDHNVETVTFDCPRYWDGLDMSELSVYINYMRKDREVGSYKATDVTVDNINSNIMHFNWTISRNVSLIKGELKFLVCIRKSDANGDEENHWNSELNSEMYISEGLEADETMFEPYPDIISQWEGEVQRVKDILLEARDNGDFDGATFTPSVDADGNLSWTNNRNLENPATVNIKGYSPVILVRDIEGGHQLVITDNRQSQTVDVMDGTDGTDGISPAVLTREIEGGYQLIITERGNPSKTITIMNGVDGVSPTVAVSDISDGHQVAITDKDGTKTFDLTNGVSPTLAVTDITGGHRVTITDKNGTRSFDVMDGAVEVSEAIKDYMNTYFYIGEVEPTSGPSIWFDTSATGVN